LVFIFGKYRLWDEFNLKKLSPRSPAALDWLVQLGYDPQFGACPLRRVIRKKVLNELSKQILAGTITSDDNIELSVNKKREFVFRNVKEAVLN